VRGLGWKPYPDGDESIHQGDCIAKQINGLLATDLTATMTATWA